MPPTFNKPVYWIVFVTIAFVISFYCLLPFSIDSFLRWSRTAYRADSGGSAPAINFLIVLVFCILGYYRNLQLLGQMEKPKVVSLIGLTLLDMLLIPLSILLVILYNYYAAVPAVLHKQSSLVNMFLLYFLLEGKGLIVLSLYPPSKRLDRVYNFLLLLVVVLDCYLIYDNILSHFRWKDGWFYIRNDHYALITPLNASFCIFYSLTVLVCSWALFRRKTWAYSLWHVLALPAILFLILFCYIGFFDEDQDPISLSWWLALIVSVSLLVLIISRKKRLFPSVQGYYSWKEVLVIFGGLCIFAASFYLMVMKQ